MPDDARTLVVTGASSGIGRALALDAARAGYRVLMIARRGGRLEEVARAIRDAGGAPAILVGDVTARETPGRVVDAALRAFGRIDVVVNNAGRGAFGSLLEQSDAQIEAQWQLHVAGPLRIARAVIPHLETTHGQLTFVGSGVGRVPLPQWGAYALTKAALRAAAIQLRRELRARRIAVTYVDPGVVATEFHANSGIELNVGFAASPQSVARRILRGIGRRRAVVHGVPWQTAVTTLGEWSGALADSVVIDRFAARRRPVEESHDSAANETLTTFEKALEPVARRMERVKLPPAFLRDALVPGAALELNALAMQWAGMPNKNERAALRESLDALVAGGYLERLGDETWSVVRAAD